MKMQGRRQATLVLSLLGLLVISIGLHFWGLGWFNSLVFDEVYYVPFALNYLNGKPFFDAHPPLGKYLLALGTGLGQLPTTWFNWPTFVLGEQSISALSYRWLNALVGSTLPVIVALLGLYLSAGYSLQRRLAFAFLGGCLILMAGLPLVESRFALINIYWVWFGVLGQLCWVIARVSDQRTGPNGNPQAVNWAMVWRIAAGTCLGAAVNVKWNGAGFWLGILFLEVFLRWQIFPGGKKLPIPWTTSLVGLGIVPLLTYILLWVPHLRLNQVSLIEIHHQLWVAHQSIGNTVAPHPYCSAWYTWPLMLRPVGFFYEYVVGTPSDSILAPVLSTGPTTYTVQGMGNPLLWWLATAAVVALGTGWVSRQVRKIRGLGGSKHSRLAMMGSAHPSRSYRGAGESELLGDTYPTVADVSSRVSPVVSFVLVNYVTNWLPWIGVNRCTFLYHALGMVIFGSLALAWLLSRWLLDYRWHYRAVAWMMVVVILWGFWFWLPVFLGLPLAPEALQQRWWLRSWI